MHSLTFEIMRRDEIEPEVNYFRWLSKECEPSAEGINGCARLWRGPAQPIGGHRTRGNAPELKKDLGRDHEPVARCNHPCNRALSSPVLDRRTIGEEQEDVGIGDNWPSVVHRVAMGSRARQGWALGQIPDPFFEPLDSLGRGGSVPPIVTSGRLAAKYHRIAAGLHAEPGARLHLARYTRRHD